ncbi:MAG: anaerobic sulfite reductase subunit AsrB [Lentisphaerae bacterium]|nr:anaerobic sulfite reductase subunit AsrB [Lentisphaerota bacterium]MCP4102435.1 anaerobic sulfite reductase subunit AsrB [Lentisphaerota bacterium]
MSNPYLPVEAKILSFKDETDIDRTYRIKCDIPVNGGQFFQVSLPGAGEAPISISDFNEDSVDLTIRNVGKLTTEIFKLKVGDKLFIRGPYGNGFNLAGLENKKLIVIAGGTGLAPVKNVINHFCKNRDKLKSFDLILGFKSPEDILFSKEIERWKSLIDVILTVDKGEKSWKGDTGLVTEYIKTLGIEAGPDYSVIVVGPPVMIKFTTMELLKNGISENQIIISLERNMSCGIGKCGHCKIDSRYVCLDGPVFDYIQAKNLID